MMITTTLLPLPEFIFLQPSLFGLYIIWCYYVFFFMNLMRYLEPQEGALTQGIAT